MITPLLTQIARLDAPAHWLTDILIFCNFLDRMVFIDKVWYRTNYSRCFAADVDIKKFNYTLFSEKEIFVWAIPPHSSDHFLDDNPTHLPPLIIPFLVGRQSLPGILNLGISSISIFYIGIWNLTCSNYSLNLTWVNDASLYVINSSEIAPHNFINVSFQIWIEQGKWVAQWATRRIIPIALFIFNAYFKCQLQLHST